MATFYIPESGSYSCSSSNGKFKLEIIEGALNGNFCPVTITAYYWLNFNSSYKTYGTASLVYRFTDNASDNARIELSAGDSNNQIKITSSPTVLFQATINVPYNSNGEAKLVIASYTSATTSTFSTVNAGTISNVTVNLSKKELTYTVTYKGSTDEDYGFPSAQSAKVGETIVLSDHKPARTGYTFSHWNTKQDGTGSSYAPGAPYAGTQDVFLYAQWTVNAYVVSYDSNGGTGAPEDQNKIHGESLTLSTKIPIRSSHTFMGWGVSSISTTVSYHAGETYTDNAPIRLYAVWERTYIDPTIENLSVFRCDSEGYPSDDGTYAAVMCDWHINSEMPSVFDISWKCASDARISSVTIENNTSSDRLYIIIGDGEISTENVYTIEVTLSDYSSRTMISKTIPGKAYTVDFMPGGSGVAFGKPSEEAGLFEVNWRAKFNDDVQFEKPIGGRNLLKFTQNLLIDDAVQSESGISTYNSDSSLEKTDDGIKFVFSGSSSDGLHIPLVYDGCLNNNEPMILSFKYRCNVTDPGSLYIVQRATPNASVYMTDIAPLVSEENEWQHYSISFSHSEANARVSCALILFHGVGHSYTNANWIEIKKSSLKLERGHIATDWTPAPEDSDALTCYPINSIYISYSHTSPASLFGGTWTRISPYFLYGTGATGEIGGTGSVSTATTGSYAYLIKVSIWRRVS